MRREKIEENKEFHVKFIKFRCLNMLSKPENRRIFRNNISHSIEYLAVIIVTDTKCNIANYVVLVTCTCTSSNVESLFIVDSID